MHFLENAKIIQFLGAVFSLKKSILALWRSKVSVFIWFQCFCTKPYFHKNWLKYSFMHFLTLNFHFCSGPRSKSFSQQCLVQKFQERALFWHNRRCCNTVDRQTPHLRYYQCTSFFLMSSSHFLSLLFYASQVKPRHCHQFKPTTSMPTMMQRSHPRPKV